MADEVVKVERAENYLTITLNRPEKRNAINRAMIEGLDAAFASVENDKAIRAVIIRAEGRDFCSGLDLRDLEQSGVGGLPFDKIIHRLGACPVPTIAAIHGQALTGGL